MSAAPTAPPTAPRPGGLRRDFWVRFATAAVALPLVLALLWLGGWPFVLLVAVASAAGAHELMTLGSPPPRLGARGAGAVALSALFPMVAQWRGELLLPLVVAVVIWGVGAQVLAPEPVPQAAARAGRTVMAPLYAGLMLSTLVPLRALEHGIAWVCLSFLVTWGNDTGAYFAGHALGRHKMAPAVSPGKTWEGFAGGAAASLLGTLLARATFLPVLGVWDAVAIGLGAALLGPLGDLAESLLKRAAGAKDSGRILPGHGGLLDRIDALLFNAPMVYLWARYVMF